MTEEKMHQANNLYKEIEYLKSLPKNSVYKLEDEALYEAVVKLIADRRQVRLDELQKQFDKL